MPNNPNQQNQSKPNDKARDARPQTQQDKDRDNKARAQNFKSDAQNNKSEDY